MEIFDRDGKINFVDENDVVLGYDLTTQCCERAGWYLAEEEPAELADNPAAADMSGRPSPDLSGWAFDPEYCRDLGLTFHPDLDDVNAVCFRLVNGAEQKFLVLFNAQNGHYCHGFSLTRDKTMLRESEI